MFLKTAWESIFKNKLAIFLIVFLLLVIYSIFGSSKVYALLLCNEESAAMRLQCNNGPNNQDSGGCGTACGRFEPWSKYQCKDVSVGYWDWSYLSAVCSTANKCVPGEYGLRPGYCACGSSGPIYKTCCSGSTKVKCERYFVQDNYWPPEGRCPPGTEEVRGTSCPSAPAPTPTPGPGPTSPPSGPTPTPGPGPTSPPSGPTPIPDGGGGSITIC